MSLIDHSLVLSELERAEDDEFKANGGHSTGVSAGLYLAQQIVTGVRKQGTPDQLKTMTLEELRNAKSCINDRITELSDKRIPYWRAC